jgi:hypothetical protein
MNEFYSLRSVYQAGPAISDPGIFVKSRILLSDISSLGTRVIYLPTLSNHPAVETDARRGRCAPPPQSRELDRTTLGESKQEVPCEP